jgi:hypothetical protein
MKLNKSKGLDEGRSRGKGQWGAGRVNKNIITIGADNKVELDRYKNVLMLLYFNVAIPPNIQEMEHGKPWRWR